MVQLGRHMGIDSSSALEYANQKFINRFHEMEKLIKTENKDLKNMSQDQADVLTADRQTAEYFEAVIAVGVEPAAAANWVQGDVLRTLNEAKIEIDQLRATPAQLAALIHLIDNGTISANVARKVFAEMASTGDDPSDIVERQGLLQISDESALETTVDELIAAHPDEFARLEEGDKKLQGFFMGQIMKATKGQANPKIASQLLDQKAQ